MRESVCAIKLHADALVGANAAFFDALRALATDPAAEFVLFEDRQVALTLLFLIVWSSESLVTLEILITSN